MSLRVNTNIAAVNTHRNLVVNNGKQAEAMEQLSSGLKVNRGADGPASLVISERLRAQTAGLKQAIDNSEAGISMVQTAEAALDEVSSALIAARQLAVHAANEAVNDEVMLQADQKEISNILATINRVVQSPQFGMKVLLDGSKGATGVTSGANLEFVEATQATQSSGTSGYEVVLNQAARRAQMAGTVELTNEIIEQGEQLTITEGSKTVDFKTIKGETVENNLNALNAAIKEAGLNVDLMRTPEDETEANAPQVISLRHKEFGSHHSFKVSSTTQGILSTKSDVYDTIANGLDVAGEINGEEATGKGQVLTGNTGNASTDGLAVRYTGLALPGEPDPADIPDSLDPPMQMSEMALGNLSGVSAGNVTLAQNSLVFQIGSNPSQTTSLALRNMRTDKLGTGVENVSGFSSLSKVDVTSPVKAQDSMRVLDRALEEVSSTRAEIGAFQKNNLESNLNYLRIAHENVISSESVIRDADMAEAMTKFTRDQIMVESSTAMLAQANARAESVVQLLN